MSEVVPATGGGSGLPASNNRQALASIENQKVLGMAGVRGVGNGD
jgi:hypothetical protein